MYAIIEHGGKQLRVEKDALIKVDPVNVEAGGAYSFDKVLAVGEGESLTLGRPYVSGASVAAEVVESGRGEKLIVFKFKRRKRYKRKQGHRQNYSLLKVQSIVGA